MPHEPRATLRFAGFDFEFRSAPGTPAPDFPPAFRDFHATQPTSPVAAYSVRQADAALPDVDAKAILWQSDSWCLAHTDAEGFALAIHALPDERLVTVARFSKDFSAGDLVLRAGRLAAPSTYAFNYPCDQVAVMNRLTHLGAGVVHASAVQIGDHAILFSGRSGAGKTTLARLFRDAGFLLLNDDRQFLWMDGDRAMHAPTPWHGSDPEVNNRTSTLRAIFHLTQAPHNRITPIHGAEAAALLLGNTVAPFYFADALDRVLDIWDRITATVPSYRLEFTPTRAAVDLIRDSL